MDASRKIATNLQVNKDYAISYGEDGRQRKGEEQEDSKYSRAIVHLLITFEQPMTL